CLDFFFVPNFNLCSLRLEHTLYRELSWFVRFFGYGEDSGEFRLDGLDAVVETVFHNYCFGLWINFFNFRYVGDYGNLEPDGKAWRDLAGFAVDCDLSS